MDKTKFITSECILTVEWQICMSNFDQLSESANGSNQQLYEFSFTPEDTSRSEEKVMSNLHFWSGCEIMREMMTLGITQDHDRTLRSH